MNRKRHIYSALKTAAIFILLEIAAFNMLKSHGDIQNIWLSHASYRTMGALWGISENISRYFSLAKENDILSEQNLLLAAENISYRNQLEKFERQMEADSLTKSDEFTFTSARIVKMSTNSQHNYIVLDKGSADGIKPESGIITPDGIVGMVSAVSDHHAYGLTLMNTSMSISARHMPSGVAGPLVWDGKGSSSAILKNIPMHHEINVGDTICTSGYSTLFPPDLPIGTVTDSKIKDGVALNVEVKLFEDFSTMEYVIIVTSNAADEIKELEKEGRK